MLMLWMSAMGQNFAAPIWMTFQQVAGTGRACQEGREGQPCGLCLNHHAHRARRPDRRGTEREIPFMKGYTVFNVEQIEGLPAHITLPPSPGSIPCSGSTAPKVLRRHRRQDTSWRKSGLLHDGAGPRADAAVRELSGCRKYTPRSPMK